MGVNKAHGGGEYAKTIFFKLLDKCLEPDISLCAIYNSTKEIWWDSIQFPNCNFIAIQKSEEIVEVIEKYQINRVYLPIVADFLETTFPIDVEIYVTIHDLRSIEIKYDLSYIKYFDGLRLKLGALKSILTRGKQRSIDYKRYEHFFKNNQAIKIFVVSNYSKKVLLNFFPGLTEVEQAQVFYSPEKTVSHQTSSLFDEKVKSTLPYFLVIGGNRPMKNAYTAIKALDKVIAKNPTFNVIIVGKVSNTIRKGVDNISNFTFYDYVSSEDLNSLYKHSFAFIFSSLYEGFGYPPLEAMSHCVPVIASQCSSIPEVLGDAALYINPRDYKDILEKTSILIENKKLYDQMKILSSERASTVSNKQRADLELLCESLLT